MRQRKIAIMITVLWITVFPTIVRADTNWNALAALFLAANFAPSSSIPDATISQRLHDYEAGLRKQVKGQQDVQRTLDRLYADVNTFSLNTDPQLRALEQQKSESKAALDRAKRIDKLQRSILSDRKALERLLKGK
jgi:peptidoglycan hydrolase CwlO-like protein